MGAIKEKWATAWTEFPRFLGSILDDPLIMKSPLFCHYLTTVIQKAVADWKNGKKPENSAHDDDVSFYDGDRYYHGKVIRSDSLWHGLYRVDGYVVQLPADEGEVFVARCSLLKTYKTHHQASLFESPPQSINGRQIE